MKIFPLIFAIIYSFSASNVNAQMMGGFSKFKIDWNEVVEHTLREEKEGKELWEKFQAKELNCSDIDNDDFGVLGEYFMGLMMGESHASMNAMMMQAHDEDGEKQMHVVMGKRLSGCDTSAVSTNFVGGWMPMMNFTTGNMMNGWLWGYSGFGSVVMILWWALIIAGIIALIRWLLTQKKSALRILEERYAKGEIDKKEFEERRKELV